MEVVYIMTFEEAQQDLRNIQARIKELHKEERAALEKMQELCPHEKQVVIDNRDSAFLPEELIDEDEKPYRKCRICGKILG